MKKKDSAFAEKLLPVLLSTGMVFGLVLVSGQFIDMFRAREEMNQLARAYLLEMETEGYLPGDGANQLKKLLEEDCGISEISLFGTTLTPVAYGERIQLVIEGCMKLQLRVKIPFLYEKSKAWDVPVRVHLISTSKH